MSVVDSTCDSCGTTVSSGDYYCKDCKLEKNASGDRSPMGLKVLSGVMVIHAIFAIPKLATLTSLGTDIGYGLAAFVGVFIVAELALAYGFWTLKTWAYNGGMIILGIEFIFNVVTISLFSAILLGFVLGYLRSKQRIFRY